MFVVVCITEDVMLNTKDVKFNCIAVGHMKCQGQIQVISQSQMLCSS